MKKVVLVMCGGKGSRLWPVSTSDKPKQFLEIINEKSLLQNTLDRIPSDYLKIFISNIKYKLELDPYINEKDIVIYEPIARNTGQAIYVACSYLKKTYTDNFQILALPCDHIFDDQKFCELLEEGMKQLSENLTKPIITFGIKPTYPEPGFGYIQKKDNKITKFIEKPTKERAMELIQQGCLWNSGLFIFKLNTILRLYKKFNNENINLCNDSLSNAKIKNNCIILADEYSRTESISFDNLIMEKIDNGIVLEYNGPWSDIGDWKRFSENYISGNENKTFGNNIEMLKSTNTLVHSDHGEVIAIGVKNLVIIKHGDNVLIMDKDHNDEFRKLMQK